MLKKLLLGIGLLGLGSVGLAYYFWTQATSLPTWYQEQSSHTNDSLNSTQSSSSSESTGIKARIQQQIQTEIQQGSVQPNEAVSVTLKSQEFNQLVQSELSQQLRSRKLSNLAPQIQSNIENNQLEIGTVINPQKLEAVNLPRHQQAIINRVVTSFPQLKNQEIYIGITGQPKFENGQLILPNDSKVRVGNLNFTLPEISKRLGVSPQRLQQSLNLNIDQLNLRALQLKENEVTLTVDPANYAAQ
ncbi:MAG: hypothetical protein VKJ02_00265 [Snowella sp.]|nr:hypothetical protein [Snowella sp.]